MPTKNPSAPRPIRVGVDTGGTFTDFVMHTDEGLQVAKRPSTPDDPARAVLKGLETLVVGPGPLDVRHGTTVGTNAVLTESGARVAFLVTAGFEDLLHLGDGTRDDLHALHASRTSPLVPRSACFGVDERVGADGRVIRALTREHLRKLQRQVRAVGAEAVVICLLHATHHPEHEKRIAEAFASWMPVVRTSHQVCAEPRELPRAETAVLDAYVTPLMQGYLERIRTGMGGGQLSVMRSDAGRMPVEAAGAEAVRTLLSGPAAGVAAARELARRHKLDRVLTFDVGGTSTDVALIEAGEPLARSTVRLGSRVAALPGLAIETIGAGGGSIVTIDSGGALRVGPASAGATPGPACYGEGGPLCLSDAWLLLGAMPRSLLGGDYPLDTSAAKRAAAPLAKAAGCSVRVLCEGIVAVAAAATARVLRRVTTREGQTLEGAVLLAYGGGGPTLACAAAQQLGVSQILVPPHPGALAATGALMASWRADASCVAPRGTTLKATRDLETTALGRLEADVRGRLARVGAGRIRLVREVDARYVGQSFEVCVTRLPWRPAFHDLHERVHGFARGDADVEAVRLRVRAERAVPGVGEVGARVPSAPRVRRPRRDRDRVARMDRAALLAGDQLLGPARVDERTSTTWIAEGWRATVLGDTSLALTCEGRAR